MAAGHPELLALIVTLCLGAAGLAFRARRRGTGRPGRWLAAAGLLGMTYVGALVAVSLSSRPVTLEPGQAKHFCGFYLDCHIGVAVVDDRSEDAGASGEVRRHVVTVEMQSDARRATLGVTGVRVALITADGRRFQADAAETRALEERLPPGGIHRQDLVFTLPADARPVALDVSSGWWVERLIERLIIGDEDSLLHPRTTLALGPEA